MPISRLAAGPRICIGNNFALMEAALLLATIARRFRLRLAKGAGVTPAHPDAAAGAGDQSRGHGAAIMSFRSL